MATKLISHFERLNTPTAGVKLSLKPTMRIVRKKKLDKSTNVVVTRAEQVTIDRAKEMRNYRVSDFALDNLIAIGATLSASQLQASPTKAITDMQSTLADINPEN